MQALRFTEKGLNEVPGTHNRKPANQGSTDKHHGPSSHCDHDTGGVYTVRVETNSGDDQRNSDESADRKKQIRVGVALNWITAIAAGLAATYAFITYLQWRDLQRNFRLERRAWIKVTPASPAALRPGELLRAQVTITNTGATPADNVSGNIIVTLLSINESLDVAYTEGHPQFYVSLGSLPAGASESSTIPGSRPSSNQAGPAGILVNQRAIDSLKSGDLRFVTYGLLTYSDVFGVPHWLTFCHQGIPDYRRGGLDSCAAYNRTDRNK